MRLRRLHNCLILIGIVLPIFSLAQGQAPNYAAILLKLEAHPAQLHSVSATYTRTQTMAGDYAAQGKAPADYGLKSLQEVEWAFKGAKYYEQTTDVKDEAQQNAHQKADAKNHRIATRIFDGSREHDLDSAATTAGSRYHYDAVLHPPHINYMSPLDCGYLVAGKWIAAALKAGQGALVGTEQDPQFGTLSLLTCQYEYGTLRFWIAPRYNYMSVRTEISCPGPNTSGVHVIETLRCLKAVQVDGIWLPVACSSEDVRRSNGSDVPEVTTEFKDISYQVNHVPDSRFDTTMPAGSVVYDSEAGTRYYIGAHGEKILDERSVRASHEFPLRWLFLVSLTAILALTMGVLIRWRRRTAHA